MVERNHGHDMACGATAEASSELREQRSGTETVEHDERGGKLLDRGRLGPCTWAGNCRDAALRCYSLRRLLARWSAVPLHHPVQR